MKTGSISMFVKRTGLALAVVLLSSLFHSCGFCVKVGSGLCNLIGKHPLSELTASNSALVYEQPNTFIVYRGSGCAESNRSGTEVVPKVEQSVNLPGYVTHATVYLNGWHLRYLDDDHHVAGLGVVIDSIRLNKNVLTWQAAGILSDKNFDDGYNWCYEYTVIAWNEATINLLVDHKDGNCMGRDSLNTNFFETTNANTTTALSSFTRFLQNPIFANTKTATILPRGFAFEWTGCDTDHHLFQLAYNMEHSEFFLEKDKTYNKANHDLKSPLPNSVSRSAEGYISWETAVIFKDNDARRSYSFGEMVSGFGGNDLGVIQPPFSILPKEDEGWTTNCLAGKGIESKEFIIENIPYEYAMPVLAGWDLSYGCDDEHVREIGIWISDFSYEKQPNATLGTLRYKLSSVLKDNDDTPFFEQKHKVNVLGLKPTSLEKPPIGFQQQEPTDPKQNSK